MNPLYMKGAAQNPGNKKIPGYSIPSLIPSAETQVRAPDLARAYKPKPKRPRAKKKRGPRAPISIFVHQFKHKNRGEIFLSSHNNKAPVVSKCLKVLALSNGGNESVLRWV